MAKPKRLSVTKTCWTPGFLLHCGHSQRLVGPRKTKELETYYQTNTLVTGFDIIFFWVARMMMFGMHFMGEEPFETVYVHALVRDEHGQKMSKTKGNVIDPLVLDR